MCKLSIVLVFVVVCFNAVCSQGSSKLSKKHSDYITFIKNCNTKLKNQKCGLQTIPKISSETRKTGDISKQKCEEYSRYVFSTREAPLIGDPPITTNECGHKVIKLIEDEGPASRKEFPHMAKIGYEVTRGKIKWGCEGSIISENYVLTAARCLLTKQFGLAKHVTLGLSDLKQSSYHKQEIPIADRIPHPEYDYTTRSLYHDIGLLRLERPARMEPYSMPACLNSNDNFSAEKAIATSWGNWAYKGVSGANLLKVTLNLLDDASCNNSIKNPKRLKKGILHEIQMCAGSEDEENTCPGKFGGPLQVYHTDDKIQCMYDILGVKSFGSRCSSHPGIYTRVSSHIKWIEDVVWPQ